MQVKISNRTVTSSIDTCQEDQPSFCTDTDHVISDDESEMQPTMASTPSVTPSSGHIPVSELIRYNILEDGNYFYAGTDC